MKRGKRKKCEAQRAEIIRRDRIEKKRMNVIYIYYCTSGSGSSIRACAVFIERKVEWREGQTTFGLFFPSFLLVLHEIAARKS